jgi:hypothetical protein
MENLTIIRKVFGEESMSHTWVCEWKSQRKPRHKKVRQMKSMFIIFFDIKEIVHKEFDLAGPSVSSAYHCDILW